MFITTQEDFNKLTIATEKERKAITLFRKDDASYSFARIVAMNMIKELTVRHVTGSGYIPKACNDYWSMWLSDAQGGMGDLFKAYVVALQNYTGRKVKLRVAI